MGKILKYLKDSLGTVALIFLLLLVQVSSDLALPAYTSDIVDVGIQQGGIDEVAPEKMRPETLENLGLLMTDEKLAFVESAYAVNAESLLVRNKNDRQTLNELEDALGIPMVMLSAGVTSGQLNIPQLKNALASGVMTKEQLLSVLDEKLEALGTSNSTLLKQGAIQFVKAEYEAIGVDLGAVQTRYMLVAGAKMLGLTLVSVAAAICVGFFGARLAAGIGSKLRVNLFSKVVSFSSGDIEKFSTASLITRNTNDIQSVVMACVMLVRIVFYAPMMGIGGVIRVVGTNTGMGWIIAVAVAALLAIFGVVLTVAMPKFQRMQLLIDRINMTMREILTGLPVIRAFNRENHERKRFEEGNLDLTKTQLFTSRVMSLTMPLMMFLMNVTLVAIIWFGAKGIDLGNLQVGNMLAFINYTMQIVMAFLMLAMVTIFLPRAIVAAGRIEEVLNTEPSIKDMDHNKDELLTDCQGVIAFENVSFRYSDAEKDILENISFTAKPGQTTAIIGSTGSGKSTLLHLIPRFFDVSAGRITVDGIDIRDITQHKLRSLLGYVPQKGVLFSGDIESNIKFGGEYITDDDMVEATQIAQAAGFIDEKEGKYESAIAQGGTNVSGGQKQRLSIARAIAKRSKILLFDDSFSALDYKTDVVLRRALSEKVKDATVIIVAQRINTILHANQIIVLEEGKVAGVGTHAELMGSCATYQEIARSQLSDEELKGGASA